MYPHWNGTSKECTVCQNEGEFWDDNTLACVKKCPEITLISSWQICEYCAYVYSRDN